MRVREYQDIPKGLLSSSPKKLVEILKGPSLIFIRGQKNPPIFVSTLLHGNEPSGFLAMQQILESHFKHKRRPQRSIIWFIGNVFAAEKNVRHLPQQPDYNRIWNGGDGAEHKMARYIFSTMRKKKLFAAIDIHNNTGRNPFYACVNKLEFPYLQLARKFSNTMVYFRKPGECLSIAFSKLCPTTTIECGNPGDRQGIHRVKQYLDHVMNMREISQEPVNKNELNIYQTFARVQVPEEFKLSFKAGQGDLQLQPSVENLNFKTLNSPTLIGVKGKPEASLKIIDNAGRDVTFEHIFSQDELLFLKEGVTPAMFTRNLEVIKQDCFGYLMKKCEF